MTAVSLPAQDRTRADAGWSVVCSLADLPVDRGVAALVQGHQVALFRLSSGEVHAVDNLDPCSGAMVLSRGLVGSRGDRATVASPMFKQAFDLGTGACLDVAGVALAVHEVRLCGMEVHVRLGPGEQERQRT